ncbi:sensor histidine kinase [Phaeovulum sp.]|uniref:sensor histidine kinase n=1 Tax=Phaeovulum sp. TaxID=2934796 RepID=UPI0039E65F63
MMWSTATSWLARKSGISATYAPRSISHLEQRLKDYIEGSLRLFWHRQAMYFGAFVLAVSYYSFTIGLVCYWVILLSELFDHWVANRIAKWSNHNPKSARKFYRLIAAGTVFNSSAIGLFVVAVTIKEGNSAHFTPLLFLFAAALFAAMNTHQVFQVLILRLVIFAALFLFVATVNIMETRPPLTSVHWLHFFTVIFVMYFIVDCSLVFLKMYQRNLTQIENLRQERDRATAAYRAKSEFLSVVSHELRTPITSIKGPLNLICGGVLGTVTDDIQRMLLVANKNSNRLATLIDDLLDLQALDAGKLAMNFEHVDLSTLLRDAIEATGGYLRDKEISLVEVGLEHSIIVQGDEKRLMQVMANVLSNAIKFSHKGGVVEVALDKVDESARISVRDCGRGIPEGGKDKVFEEFSQIDSSDVRSAGGTGLGMSISKRIILRHNGTIDYESDLGVGTVFHITLPFSNMAAV